jgi:hypothetical protein
MTIKRSIFREFPLSKTENNTGSKAETGHRIHSDVSQLKS